MQMLHSAGAFRREELHELAAVLERLLYFARRHYSGSERQSGLRRGVDYPYIATGAYAEIGATALGFARLFGRKDSPHAESERQSRAGYRRNALESPLRAERHFKRCDAAVAKRLCEVNGSGGIVYGKHSDDARLL